ncbi:MAG TPA: CAP domain-containing protein [Chloroflexia bacterium]|nr:CAP domain-containing protein [Chloroflexia bacterium]
MARSQPARHYSRLITKQFAFLASLLSLAALLTHPLAAAPNTNTRFYTETSHKLGGAFLRFFDMHGGIPVFGYPISDELMEGGLPVQYFERQRFEYHREAAGTPYEVQLGHLGKELSPEGAPFGPVPPIKETPDQIYIEETQHTLSNAFLRYWRAHGGVQLLGYPITEPAVENGYMVQYFERARMEYHPEKAASGYEVELGHLGTEYVRVHPEVSSTIAQGLKVVPHTLTSSEQELMGHINRARQAAGLQPVGIDARLSTLALSRSYDMATRGYFAHTTPEGSDFTFLLSGVNFPYKVAGEILAHNNYGPDEAVQIAYNDFMKSASHKQVILDPLYTIVGAGEAIDGKGFHYFTVIFVYK